jgi:hypothetical protein
MGRARTLAPLRINAAPIWIDRVVGNLFETLAAACRIGRAEKCFGYSPRQLAGTRGSRIANPRLKKVPGTEAEAVLDAHSTFRVTVKAKPFTVHRL